ncbi:hypothetical protein CVT26_015692 [Gymnopilus dilepis]|uniref:GPI mannosyltransferase 2 n=1 Tax=Gymnopilus dilepis TaxID=231916 RepID=A0A409VFF5_9AGAR|nr:hypothetical protein CVT26_015692 [Gymnopilus dilepis]
MFAPFLSLAFYAALLFAASWLPLFDASPALIPNNSIFVRWDVFHFLHIASDRYAYEHEWAFLPGIAFILSVIPPGLPFACLTSLLAVGSYRTLYALSLHHLRSKELAKLASLLSLIPSSPVTLYFAPYNEPFFTYLSYRGMLCCAREQWTLAAFFFTLAGAFRSNGFFLGGFILWGLLVHPFLNGKMPTPKALLKSILLMASVVSPFVIYHLYTYSLFCSQKSSTPEWCHRTIPSIYSYTQSKYWNVGFLRYWTPSQLPNFVIAAPPICLIYAFSVHHLSKTPVFGQIASASKPGPHKSRKGEKGARVGQMEEEGQKPTAFSNPSITPHVIHALIFTSILLFASHTQIILRLAASMPVLYWAAAWLLLEHPFWGRLWVTWSVLWSMISVVLWAAFLPPA